MQWGCIVCTVLQCMFRQSMSMRPLHPVHVNGQFEIQCNDNDFGGFVLCAIQAKVIYTGDRWNSTHLCQYHRMQKLKNKYSDPFLCFHTEQETCKVKPCCGHIMVMKGLVSKENGYQHLCLYMAERHAMVFLFTRNNHAASTTIIYQGEPGPNKKFLLPLKKI